MGFLVLFLATHLAGANVAHATELQRLPGPAGAPWSRAVRSGPFVHVSAIAPVDATGQVVERGIGGQTRAVLESMSRVLEEAGTSLARAASVHVYLRNAADFTAMNEVYATFWKEQPPVRTTVVAGLSDPAALVQMSAIALMPGAPREVVHPTAWVKSPNPYSYGIRSGDTLFLAGLVSRSGRDNTVVAGDIAAQTRTVLDNAREVLSAAGMSMDDVASARVFITDVTAFPAMNTAYREYFPKDPPARATVVCGLMAPAFSVEITLVAVKDAREAVAATNADGTPRPANPNLSAAIRTADRVFVSGALGNNDATRGDLAAQARETLAALGRSLKAAGTDWSRVTDATIYVTDAKRAAEINNVLREAFGTQAPAATVAGTGLVAPDGLIEIMVNAVR